MSMKVSNGLRRPGVFDGAHESITEKTIIAAELEAVRVSQKKVPDLTHEDPGHRKSLGVNIEQSVGTRNGQSGHSQVFGSPKLPFDPV